MSSKLQGTSLRINDTQEIAKIKTSVNNENNEVPTSGAVKDLIDSLIPVTLEVEGDWTNKQVRYRIPDPAGLSFKVTYKNGDTAYVGARLVSPEAWPNTGLQTATFSYTENGITIYGTRSIGIELLPVSLTITGDWANYQYAGLAPDPNGLTFTVTYDDDSTAVVSGLTVTPGTWGNTVGTQTATFSYSQEVSGGTVTVTATKDANVVRKPISLTATGSLNDNYQFYNNPPDITGLIFTVSYSNGTTKNVSPDISPNTWDSVGQQTATFSYTDNGATVTNTQTANVVRKPSSLSIESGSLSDNYQYTNTAPNASTLRFKVYYNNGTSSEEKTVSDGIAVSPETWSSSTGQQTATFSYTENGVTVSAVRNANNIVRKLTGLTVGPWNKIQYTGRAVDYTGMDFIAIYNNNTTARVTPSDYNPKIWSSTVGTQTCTFYYSENGIEMSASRSANVALYVDSTLDNNTWATIRQVADAGTASQYWSVGDYKEVSVAAGVVDRMVVDAGTYRAVIIGINHNPTWENPKSIDFAIGQNTSGTEIMFYNGTHKYGVRINSSRVTTGGWVGSEMYLTFLPQFYSLLSGNTGLQDAMIAPKKYTHNNTGGETNDTEANVTLSENGNYKLFLMAEFEVQGTRNYANSYEQNKQAQYYYYSSSGLAKSKIRYAADNGTTYPWWTRSALCKDERTTYWTGVHNSGTGPSDTNFTNTDSGICPCFRV